MSHSLHLSQNYRHEMEPGRAFVPLHTFAGEKPFPQRRIVPAFAELLTAQMEAIVFQSVSESESNCFEMSQTLQDCQVSAF